MATKHRALTVRAIAKAVKLLNSGKYTRQEAADAAEIDVRTLYRYIREQRAKKAAADA